MKQLLIVIFVALSFLMSSCQAMTTLDPATAFKTILFVIVVTFIVFVFLFMLGLKETPKMAKKKNSLEYQGGISIQDTIKNKYTFILNGSLIDIRDWKERKKNFSIEEQVAFSNYIRAFTSEDINYLKYVI